MKTNSDENLSIVLLGNKSDLVDKREVTTEEGKEKAEKNKFAFIETSALNGYNIDKAFNELIEQIYQSVCSEIEDGESVEIDKGVNLNDDKKDSNGFLSNCCSQYKVLNFN